MKKAAAPPPPIPSRSGAIATSKGWATTSSWNSSTPRMSGEYHMTMDPSEKDALLYVPNAGLTLMEQMGLACKTDRFTRTDGTHLGTGSHAAARQHERVQPPRAVRQDQPPPVDQVQGSGSGGQFHHQVQPAADEGPRRLHSGHRIVGADQITIQFERKDLQFKQKEGISTASVNVYGRITSMSRRPVDHFEEDLEVQVPTEMLQTGHGRVRHLSGDRASSEARPLPVDHRGRRIGWAEIRPLSRCRWKFRN